MPKKAKIHFPTNVKGAMNRVSVRYISPQHIFPHGMDVTVILRGEKYLPDSKHDSSKYISNMYENVKDSEILILVDGEYFAIDKSYVL